MFFLLIYVISIRKYKIRKQNNSVNSEMYDAFVLFRLYLHTSRTRVIIIYTSIFWLKNLLKYISYEGKIAINITFHRMNSISKYIILPLLLFESTKYLFRPAQAAVSALNLFLISYTTVSSQSGNQTRIVMSRSTQQVVLDA